MLEALDPLFAIGQPVYDGFNGWHYRVIHRYKAFSNWLLEDIWMYCLTDAHGNAQELCEHFLEPMQYSARQRLKVVK